MCFGDDLLADGVLTEQVGLLPERMCISLFCATETGGGEISADTELT